MNGVGANRDFERGGKGREKAAVGGFVRKRKERRREEGEEKWARLKRKKKRKRKRER